MKEEILKKIEEKKAIIGVIGLGYVGLPLATEFGKKFKVIGFDINQLRIKELQNGFDKTLEVSENELKDSKYLSFSSTPEDIKQVDVFIVTVPTPVDRYNRPDLTPLIKASETVGKIMKKGSIVVYESTVYPGCTEDDCVPVLEKFSGFKFNVDFFCGYSPERINPGDKDHRVSSIKKIVSGSTPEIGEIVNVLYGSIISAGTHLAPSIKVAEAAKVIENSQRDINIAFVNELAKLFDLMAIDTLDVLEAAGTKWNFLPFKPGLVGGHCIGVDPYYLTHKAVTFNYHPEIILAGRRINDGMGAYVAKKLIQLMIKKGHKIDKAKILVLGITFKENCPDVRNSKVVDIVSELKEFGCDIDIYDPWANKDEVQHEYHLPIKVSEKELTETYDGIVLAVSHSEFKKMDFKKIKNGNTVIFDVKGFLPKEIVDGRL
ncbi:MAG: nucleotide sugar dehydrogenase [Bacteroidota bacterium]|nr:nucleotide sugar dehydrogenase [Bacteroidota bacterium]